MNKTLENLLKQLPQGAALDFSQLQAALEAVRYTGPITYDYLNGLPRQINLGQPVKLTICAGALTGPKNGG